MNAQPSFAEPGHDGRLPGGASIWRKDVVYTRRVFPDRHLSSESPFRVSTAFTCGPTASAAKKGFQSMYRRVRSLSEHAISEGLCPDAMQSEKQLLCHGWRNIEGTNLCGAFLMLRVRCRPAGQNEHNVDFEPSERELLQSGGSSDEELTRLSPQRSEVFYNEFDFSDPSMLDSDLVTTSYGERLPAGPAPDYESFVRRAEKQAERYHAFLDSQGETRSRFGTIYREWFLAHIDFVTVHVCFYR